MSRNETRQRTGLAAAQKHSRGKGYNLQNPVAGCVSNINAPATGTAIQAPSSGGKPYVPPHRLRSPEQNATMGQAILEDLPHARRRVEMAMKGPPTCLPWPNNLRGDMNTQIDGVLSPYEEEAHVRMLAWENWALRNVLMYGYGWSRQGIDFALDIERQRLAGGG